MPDKPRDPLDEADDLLAEDEPTDAIDQPEPGPTDLEPPPEPPPFVWEGEAEEPIPSEIEILSEETDEPVEDSEEPKGEDLYWAEVEENETDPEWHEPEDEPAGLDWPVEDEDQLEEEDWAELEERPLLPADRLLVGLEEQASLPELGLSGVPAVMETGRLQSVLSGSAGGDPITTTLCIGALELTVTLHREIGPVLLRLGQDVITGRFVVDPSQRMVLSAAE